MPVKPWISFLGFQWANTQQTCEYSEVSSSATKFRHILSYEKYQTQKEAVPHNSCFCLPQQKQHECELFHSSTLRKEQKRFFVSKSSRDWQVVWDNDTVCTRRMLSVSFSKLFSRHVITLLIVPLLHLGYSIVPFHILLFFNNLRMR